MIPGREMTRMNSSSRQTGGGNLQDGVERCHIDLNQHNLEGKLKTRYDSVLPFFWPSPSRSWFRAEIDADRYRMNESSTTVAYPPTKSVIHLFRTLCIQNRDHKGTGVVASFISHRLPALTDNESNHRPLQVQIVPCVVVTDVFHDLPRPLNIRRQQALLHVLTEHVAENATEVIVAGEGQETA